MFKSRHVQEVYVKTELRFLHKNQPGTRGYTSPQPDTRKGYLSSYWHDGLTLEIIYIVETDQVWYVLFEGKNKLGHLPTAATANGRQSAELWLKAHDLPAKMTGYGERLVRILKKE